ncbi:MAG: response regulator transcription factor [Algicola sp.]|nr:response regulator transcription factor [Algicola sp.]
MKIYLADDHQVVRDGLKLLLGAAFEEADFYQSGTFGDLLDKVKADSAQDLILCDLHMPDMESLKGIETIRKAFPNILLIVLSGHFTPNDIDAALSLGVNGFVSKTSQGASLVNIIRLVQAGETYLPSNLADNYNPQYLQQEHQQKQQQKARQGILGSLTPREVEVLTHLASGFSNKIIARQLCIAESTIKTHVKTIYRKLDVSSRIEAAKMAMKLALPEVAIG